MSHRNDPFTRESDAPNHVPDAKRAQWMSVWNRTFSRASGSRAEREARAFRAANAAIAARSDSPRRDGQSRRLG